VRRAPAGMFSIAIWDRKGKASFSPGIAWKEAAVLSWREGLLLLLLRAGASGVGPGDPGERRSGCNPSLPDLPERARSVFSIRRHPEAPAGPLDDGKGGREELRRYWKLSFVPKHPADTAARRVLLEEELLEKVREAVRVRLVSDVPLGALLSGGVDSSGVVALMSRENSGKPVKTFSVGFREKEFNELEYAREVALLYGTDHKEFTLHPDMLSVLPLLVERFGEPFADSAAIPTYYISSVAREHVTVALCGDAVTRASPATIVTS